MNFLLWSGLALSLLGIIPFIAHRRKQGKRLPLPFAPFRWLPQDKTDQDARAKIQHPLLLAARITILLLVALIAASPVVRCSRLSINRQGQQAIELWLIIDRSESMMTETNGETRFKQAISTSLELLASLRSGDQVAIIDASSPAQLILPLSQDLEAAEQLLQTLEAHGGNTDLNSALDLAPETSSPSGTDQRVVLLSDFQVAELPSLDNVLTPLGDIAAASKDCLIAELKAESSNIAVRIICNHNFGKGKLSASTFEIDDSKRHSELKLAPQEILLKEGEQFAYFETKDSSASLIEVILELKDDNLSNNQLSAPAKKRFLNIILVKDPTAPPPLTGEAPLLEQAILALHPDAEVHRLDHLPSRAEDLASADLLILDNPAGLGPESRLAIDEWSKRAGLSLLLLGPRMAEAQLSTNFSPFLDSAPHWESIAPNLELDGANNAGLAKLQAQGRANWSGPSKSGDEVLMKWQDEIPFFMRRINGLGELLILGLPSHQESSELAFRPGFLKILDSAIGRASGNAHERLLLPGQALSQERLRPLSAEQWLGGHFEKLHSPCASSLSSSKTKNTGSLQSTAQPCLGRYFVRGSGVYRLNYEEKQQWLAVARDPEEFLRSPIKLPEAVQNQLGVNRDTGLSLSPYLAFLVLFAIAVDLLLSLGSPWKKAIKAS